MTDPEQPKAAENPPPEPPLEPAPPEGPLAPEPVLPPTPKDAPAAVPSLIAPDVPRLGMPTGAGRHIPAEGSPSYIFLAIVSITTLGVDIASKLWAEKMLDLRPPITVIKNHMEFILARNKGGAWGLLQGTSESVRRPFFLLVSALAIGFIVTLFSRLQPRQRALRWGLPLVLGGALGNVFDRIRYGWVIDFIDVHTAYKGIDHHWPTFNVADIAICLGVGLMAVDMLTSKRGPKRKADASPDQPAPAASPESAQQGAAAVESSEAAPAEPAAPEPKPDEATVGEGETRAAG